jgi:hypothetical protein
MVSRKAVINAGTVENVILADDDFELPDRVLITLPEGSIVAPGWTYDGEDFAPPVIVHDMDALKAAAVKTAMDFGSAITGQVTGAYAQAEILSWDKQEAEARIVVDGGTLPASAILPGLAEDKNEDLATYAASVVAKADAFRAIARAAVYLRRRISEVILDPAVTTPAELETAVAGLRAECEAIAAQLIPAAT